MLGVCVGGVWDGASCHGHHFMKTSEPFFIWELLVQNDYTLVIVGLHNGDQPNSYVQYLLQILCIYYSGPDLEQNPEEYQ